MTSLEAYKYFLLKLNRNDSNVNISVSKAEFVLLYNEQRYIWLESKLKLKNPDIDIQDLGPLLVKDSKLQKSKDDDNSSIFKLPQDFMKFDSSYSIASKNKCKGRVLTNWPVKPRNISVLLLDSNMEPSFEYEETLCIVSSEGLVVYRKDFNIDEVYLSYYKLPKEIDIEGYIKLDGSSSSTINPDDLPNDLITQIVNHCVMEVSRNYENQLGAQFAKDRIINEG